MTSMKYRLYIESKDRTVKIYWNTLLQAWVKYKENATLFDKFEWVSLPFGIQFEEVEEKSSF